MFALLPINELVLHPDSDYANVRPLQYNTTAYNIINVNVIVRCNHAMIT